MAMTRLQEKYKTQVAPRLAQQLGRTNPHALPRIEKIVINMGVGKAIQDRKVLDEAAGHLALIAGQKPIITKSKKAISGFRLRANLEIGCKVTLRGRRMFEFLDRLITLALPRVRDFRGLNPKSFDGRGNYSLGLSEQLVFPEVPADKTNYVQGMHVTIVTSARNDDEGRLLLREMGLPLQA
jgi:large subunit ribosomal protein L5